MNENKKYHYECTEDPSTFQIFETSSYELVATVYSHAETTKIVGLLELDDLETELRLKDEKIKRLEDSLKNYAQKDEDQSFLDIAAIAAMNSLIIAGHRTELYKEVNDDEIAEWSYQHSNALLAEKKRLQSID